MADELTTIELGDDFAPQEDADLTRKRRVHGRRSVLVAALAALALLVLGGSVARATPPVPKVATVEANTGGSFMVVGSKVVVADIRDGRNAITAYALPGGRLLWSTTLTVLANNLQLQRVGDIVIAAFQFDGVGDQTDAIDLRSGALVWHSAGYAVHADEIGRTVLLDRPVNSGTHELSLVDVPTGKSRWADDLRVGCNWVLAADIVELCADTATLRVVGLDDGRTKSSRKVDLGMTYSFGGPVTSVDEIKLAEQDGVVVVGHPGSMTEHSPWMDAYRSSDLTRLWRKPFYDSAYINACGQIFCMSDGQISTGLDPRTGKTLPFPGYDSPDGSDTGYRPVGRYDSIALIPGIPAGLGIGPPDSDPSARVSFFAHAVPSYPQASSISLPSSTRISAWIATVRFERDKQDLIVTPVQQLPNVGVHSCALIDMYLACAVDVSHLVFFRVDGLRN